MINSSRLNEVLFYHWFRDGEYKEEDYQSPKLEVECVSGAFFAIKYSLVQKIRIF